MTLQISKVLRREHKGGKSKSARKIGILLRAEEVESFFSLKKLSFTEDDYLLSYLRIFTLRGRKIKRNGSRRSPKM